MIDELVRQVSERIGLSEEKSRQAVDVVVEQLGQRLPEPFGSQFEKMVRNNEQMDISKLGESLGGLFGRK